MKSRFHFLAFMLIFIFAFGNCSFAQDNPIAEKIKNELDDNDLKKLEGAAEDIMQGDAKLDKVGEEDDRIDKYFKKKNKKKAEKKAVLAKQMRIDAAKKYASGYSAIYDVYARKLASVKFQYPDDESLANRYLEDAESLFKRAKDKLNGYKKLKKKDLKKTVQYSKLKRDLAAIPELMKQANDDQLQAFSLWQKQEQKMAQEEADESAWEKALAANTIEAYQIYLANYPYGKYSALAQNKISEIQAAIEREQEKNKVEDDTTPVGLANGLVFKVQIIAVSQALTTEQLQEFYGGSEDVYEIQDEGLYKYSIGTFTSYNEANDYSATVGVSDAFVIAFKDGVKISVLEAKELLKGNE